MELAMNGLQAGAIDMSVVLGSADAGVTQQLLHSSQIGAPRQQVRGKAVP